MQMLECKSSGSMEWVFSMSVGLGLGPGLSLELLWPSGKVSQWKEAFSVSLFDF